MMDTAQAPSRVGAALAVLILTVAVFGLAVGFGAGARAVIDWFDARNCGGTTSPAVLDGPGPTPEGVAPITVERGVYCIDTTTGTL